MKRPRPRMRKQTLLMVLLLLTGGAIINVAVAWGCAAWSSLSTFNDRLIDEADARWLTGHGERAEFDGGDTFVGVWLYGGSGITWEEFHLQSDQAVQSRRRFVQDHPNAFAEFKEFTCVRFLSGWPIRSLATDTWHHTPEWENQFHAAGPEEERGGWPLPEGNDLHHRRFLSWMPLWPAFAINTILYAAILWPICATPFALRRCIRAQRGQCPACAYPIGSSPVCTECGKAVRQKAIGNGQ